MKTKLLTAALLMSLSALSLASSNGKGPEGDRKVHHQKIQKLLNLTEEQKTQFDTIMQNRKEKRREDMKANHQQTKAELAKFLSPEQMKILDENRPERKMGKNRRGSKRQRN